MYKRLPLVLLVCLIGTLPLSAGSGRHYTDERIDGMLRLLALYDDRHVPVSAYSKGMRQKILLAAALLHTPELLLLDEPF